MSICFGLVCTDFIQDVIAEHEWAVIVLVSLKFGDQLGQIRQTSVKLAPAGAALAMVNRIRESCITLP